MRNFKFSELYFNHVSKRKCIILLVYPLTFYYMDWKLNAREKGVYNRRKKLSSQMEPFFLHARSVLHT